ncbi:MAG TPA: glycosyltransferase family 39 protein [Pseudomonadales bacterium]|nr:glycosyltransferase family 39 protein [Pseudomonadales bacterium]
MTETPHRSLLHIWSALLLLMLLSVSLRWDAYPKTYFADELIPRTMVKHMQASHSLDTNWENADWRGDFAGGFYKLKQYNFSSYHTALLGLRELANLTALHDVPDLVLYRSVSLIFQLVCIVLVFSIANRLAGMSAGLLAAAFMALMPQAVVDAHYARPESFVMLLIALASWLAMRAYAERNWRYILPEAVVWGVAFSCKFSFFPMVLLACAAQIIRFRNPVILAIWCASFVAGIAISAPYILLDIPGFFYGIKLLLGQYAPQSGESGWLAQYLPSAYQLFPYLGTFFSIPVLFVMVVSGVQRSSPARCFAWYASGISAFYILLFASQGVFFERNFSHLMPLWAVMFALGFLVVFRFIKERWYFWVVAALFFIWPLYLSNQINEYFFRGIESVKDSASSYEESLLAQYASAKVVPFQLMGANPVESLSAQDILRVPEHKLAGLQQVQLALENAGFKRVGYFEMPLSFLPYNQLQINQFPPAYIYYRREARNRSDSDSEEQP